MSRTLIRNITGEPLTLPLPYGGVLAGGAATIVPETDDVVISYLGGLEQIRNIWLVYPVDATNPIGPITLESGATSIAIALESLPQALDLNGQKITNLGTPTANTDAATKLYVDTHGGGGGSGTVTSITAGTGLTGGTITTSGTIALEALSPNPAGSFTSANITVDPQGRITAAANGSGGGGSLVTLAQEIFVAKNGNDTTGDGSLSKPYLTISRALTDANAGAANTYYRINVSPGLYTENLSITKQRIMVAGCSSAPEQYQTSLTGTVTINPTASTDKYSDAVALYGMLISSNVSSVATITITGSQAYGVSIDNCYVTTTSTNSNAIFCDASNVARPVIYIRNSIVTKQINGATVPVIRLDRGDCRIDTVRVYASITGAAEGVSLANDATLAADRLQVDKATSGAGIRINTTYAGVSCTISNSSINCTYTGALTSPALDLNNATGIAAFVWQCLFLVADLSSNNAIDGTFNGATTPLVYGNLAFAPGTNTAMAAAVNAAKVPMTVIP